MVFWGLCLHGLGYSLNSIGMSNQWEKSGCCGCWDVANMAGGWPWGGFPLVPGSCVGKVPQAGVAQGEMSCPCWQKSDDIPMES